MKKVLIFIAIVLILSLMIPESSQDVCNDNTLRRILVEQLASKGVAEGVEVKAFETSSDAFNKEWHYLVQESIGAIVVEENYVLTSSDCQSYKISKK